MEGFSLSFFFFFLLQSSRKRISRQVFFSFICTSTARITFSSHGKLSSFLECDWHLAMYMDREIYSSFAERNARHLNLLRCEDYFLSFVSYESFFFSLYLFICTELTNKFASEIGMFFFLFFISSLLCFTLEE